MTSNTNYDKNYKNLANREKGFVNHPKDPGGATNHGITLGFLSDYKGRPATVAELKALTNEDAKVIIKSEIWDKFHGDEIQDPALSNVMLSMVTHRGPSAIKEIQKNMGITPADGHWGPVSTAYANTLTPETMKAKLSKVLDANEKTLLSQIAADPKKAVFEKGWLARNDELRTQSGIPTRTKKLNRNYASNSRTDIQSTDSNLPLDNQLASIELNDSILAEAMIDTSDYSVAVGHFQFNDILLDIPPESISIMVNEFEDSYILLREATPTTVQSGKKRIRIIVNFPIDLGMGDAYSSYQKLAQMLIQIRKTPIATVRNEKIETELFGNGSKTSNIGVVVDNLSGYLDEENPNLLRCTLQMSWFNHTPYVTELRYATRLPNGQIRTSIQPSRDYVEFYTEGTTEMGTLNNYPAPTTVGSDSLVIFYKQFERHPNVFEMSAAGPSRLNAGIKRVSIANFEQIQQLKEQGWYLAEEQEDRFLTEPSDGVFYRWRKFEIPFTDLGENGALILQNMSFSLSTNPTYMDMEQHAVPTVQFLGGSSASLRALVFGTAEYQSETERTPTRTSKKLGQLSDILRSLSEDRLDYNKYSKENHLLIAHPLAKLMKYQKTTLNMDTFYVDEYDNRQALAINDCLPVIISSSNSSTIPGLPFASRLQLDFKETRLNKRKKTVKARPEVTKKNSSSPYLEIIDKVVAKFNIRFNDQTKTFEYDPLELTPDSDMAGEIVGALNNLNNKDETVTSVPAAYKSKYFLLKGGSILKEEKTMSPLEREQMYAKELAATGDTKEAWRQEHIVEPAKRWAAFEKAKKREAEFEKKQEARIAKETAEDVKALNEFANESRLQETYVVDQRIDRQTFRANEMKAIEKVHQQRRRAANTFFNQSFLASTVFALFGYYVKGLAEKEPWVDPYVPLFTAISSLTARSGVELYPDMMIPKTQKNPGFYFANDSDRIDAYKQTIIQNFPKISAATDKNLSENIMGNKISSLLGDDIKPGVQNYPLSFNNFMYPKKESGGLPLVHLPNSQDYRSLNGIKAISEMTPHSHSINHAYPTFHVELYADRYTFLQKLSSVDVKSDSLFDTEAKDLLDIFDLSSIIDIRIIKDENEAADVMIIRLMSTQKKLINKNENADIFYVPETFTWSKAFDDALGVSPGVKGGRTSVAQIYDANLERAGIKEGIKIKAMLGHSSVLEELDVEFSGKIAAISGEDIVEIYCIGNGHELIQNTMGFDGGEHYSLNSDTPDLIAKMLSEANEVKSFGNTSYEIAEGISLSSIPLFMGGRSALDNIYAPSVFARSDTAGSDSGDRFIAGIVSAELKGLAYFHGALALASATGLVTAGTAAVGTQAAVSATIAGIAIEGGVSFLALAPAAGILIGAGYLAYQTYKYVKETLSPCPFIIFQQTIWDVVQELTFRHPGFICSVVPFDNRSTLYFGEPDGLYFCRGPENVLERIAKSATSNRTTIRESLDKANEVSKNQDWRATTPIAIGPDRFNPKTKSGPAITDLQNAAFTLMQKPFRTYHLVTSEHDMIANEIEVSSRDVANSVQVYHPNSPGSANFDGTTWFSSYSLTSMMKADDDLTSDLINNKVFTFHNAFKDSGRGLDLPEKYALGVLCKEMSKIYQGKLVILGRTKIKPHDIVILRDTANLVTGPVGVRRVVQSMSPQSGWTTTIYPKFVVIPDTSAGALQMSTVLKAARFWLSDEAELFYSSMEKFNPSENTGKSAQAANFLRAVELTSGQQDKTANRVGKEELYGTGPESSLPALQQVGVAAANSGLAAATNAAGLNLIAPRLVDSAFESALGGANAFFAAKTGLAAATGVKATAQVVGTGLWGVASNGGMGLLKIGSAGFSLFGGIALSYLLDNAIESFTNWSKYRQPVHIFPLKKNGMPWMAGLNGFRENTIGEHLELEGARALDRVGAYVYYARSFMNEWVNGEPNLTRASFGEKAIANKIEDGDTFTIQGSNEKIRAEGYDAPEILHNSDGGEMEKTENYTPYSDEKALGEKARKRLIQLIGNGQEIEVIRNKRGLDRYGRTVARVRINGQDIASIMIQEKLAMMYDGKYKGSEEERHTKWTNFIKENQSAHPEIKPATIEALQIPLTR